MLQTSNSTAANVSARNTSISAAQASPIPIATHRQGLLDGGSLLHELLLLFVPISIFKLEVLHMMLVRKCHPHAYAKSAVEVQPVQCGPGEPPHLPQASAPPTSRFGLPRCRADLPCHGGPAGWTKRDRVQEGRNQVRLRAGCTSASCFSFAASSFIRSASVSRAITSCATWAVRAC